MVFHGGFAWIVSEINRGRIFPEMEWGKEFLWESNGDCNNNNSNSNHIRLVLALKESGRGKNGLFRDSLLWKATGEMASSWPSQRK